MVPFRIRRTENRKRCYVDIGFPLKLRVSNGHARTVAAAAARCCGPGAESEPVALQTHRSIRTQEAHSSALQFPTTYRVSSCSTKSVKGCIHLHLHANPNTFAGHVLPRCRSPSCQWHLPFAMLSDLGGAQHRHQIDRGEGLGPGCLITNPAYTSLILILVSLSILG